MACLQVDPMLKIPPFEDRLSRAVAHYWAVLEAQSKKQKARSRNPDRGQRSAVTGGKQMAGVMLRALPRPCSHPSTAAISPHLPAETTTMH